MEITREIVQEGFEKGVIEGDGHGINFQAFYQGIFGDLSHLEFTHRSDGSHKGSIYVNGEMVEELTGIYNLTFLEWLGGQCGLSWRDWGSYGGRGFQAQAIERTIHAWAFNENYQPKTEEQYQEEQAEIKRKRRAEVVKNNPDLFEDEEV